MNKRDLKKILVNIKEGKMTPDKAMDKLKLLPFENLGFARIDHHRSIRQGFPEVIYCEGKTDQQVMEIVNKMIQSGSDILATRTTENLFNKIHKLYKNALFNKQAGIIVIKEKKTRLKGKILLTTAGSSDIPVAEEAAVTAETMGSKVDRLYDVGVAGIHRLFEKKEMIFKANVIIVAAGMDGALASVIGGLAECPVVAVPTSVGYGANFKGISALLAMLNSCAPGVGVMNIDNGFGAGCFAHKINMKVR